MLRVWGRSFGKWWSKFSVPGVVRETKQYKEEMTKARKRLLADYNEHLRVTENEWINNYTQQQEEKWTRDMDKWRTSVCNIGLHTRRTLIRLREKDAQLAEKNQTHTLRTAQASFERRLMLDAMEIESAHWYTKENAEKIATNVSAPASIFDSQDYNSRIEQVWSSQLLRCRLGC